MRFILALLGATLLAVFATVAPAAKVSFAAFHCMRIHAVKQGFAGNPNVQYVELRMDAGGQSFVNGHTMEFFDDSNTLKATFTFPSNVTNALTGDSILIASAEFVPPFTSGGSADFTFTVTNTTGANGGDPLHPIQSPNGRVVFAPPSLNCNSTAPVDSVAYGTATANYGSAAVALPGASDPRALRLKNLNLNPTNNSAEYDLQAVSSSTFSVPTGNLASDLTTPRNNGRTVIRMAAPPSVGGVADAPLAAANESAAAVEGGRKNRDWIWYAVAGALTATAIVAGTGALLRRMRT